MKLSVIVPVYNMAKENKLQFCLDSLLHQTVTDLEIIAVDDASSDDSPKILQEYHDRYPGRVKIVLSKENKKQGGAKNTGLDLAEGEWVGFVDSDDWVSPDCYEKLLAKAEETGADVVGCQYCVVYSHTFEVGDIVKNNTPEQTGVLTVEQHKSLLNHFGSMVVKIYKREILEKNKLRFPEKIFYEDNCAGPLWSLHFTHFELVDEPLYYYYQNAESTVHVITVERCYHRLQACEILLREMQERGFYDTYKDELEYLFITLYFKNTLFSYMLSPKREKGIAFVKELKSGILRYFPNFRQSKYYVIPDAEEAKMIDLLMKNTYAFYFYYTFLWFYRRNLRKYIKRG